MFRSFVRAAVVAASLLAATSAFAEPAADFTLRDVNGQEVKLSQFKGQVVLLSFWATWCGPCKVEMTHLHELYKKHEADGLKVLFISTDDARTAPQVKPYVMQHKYEPTLFLLDKQSEVVGVYNPPKTLPFGVLIGRDGSKVKNYSGYNPGDEVHVAEDVLAELAKPAPAQ